MNRSTGVVLDASAAVAEPPPLDGVALHPRGRSSLMLTIERLTSNHDTLLRNLYEHYVHDMSEWLGLDVREDGSFGFDTKPFWTGDFAVYLARNDGAIAGFGVITSGERWLGRPAARDVKDFFVLRKYRHRGVADALAAYLWDSVRTEWIVRVLATNVPALAFWRRAVTAYTSGTAQEREVRENERAWVHLRFDNTRR